ncbi:HAD domain-containing protein [Paracidovorax konjaci]|uniref:HAD domain-containing protein n=1 Tax=Paracidovorax konjaci TaxID=32040 RepID=UPI001113B1EF|nr:HAD domain-containing protein [Paracidovorax konjaci]
MLFLDLDDTLCLNAPYGGLHARQAVRVPGNAPPDFYERLFAPGAVAFMNTLLDEFQPGIVLTTSWLALLEREDFIEIFCRTGLQRVANALHAHWDAPSNRGTSRVEAIDAWLARYHEEGQPVLILDDVISGESLIGSFHEGCGRAVLCEVDQGLNEGHLNLARQALKRPYVNSQPWL